VQSVCGQLGDIWLPFFKRSKIWFNWPGNLCFAKSVFSIHFLKFVYSTPFVNTLSFLHFLKAASRQSYSVVHLISSAAIDKLWMNAASMKSYLIILYLELLNNND